MGKNPRLAQAKSRSESSKTENDVTGNAVGNASGNEDAGSTDNASGGADVGSWSGSEISVDVNLPVKWQEDGQAVCHVVFEFNNEEIVEHCPVETWHSGKHILSLYYPIEKIVANYTNTFNVYLWMENGSGTVDVGDCIASVSEQAMAAGEAWDGKLEVEDYTTRFAIGGGLDNNVKPLPRGYAMQCSDECCDTCVSAAEIKAGCSEPIGRECGVEEHVKIFKKLWI